MTIVNNNDRLVQRVHSFVLRQRPLSERQQHALKNYWTEIGINFSEKKIDFISLFGRKVPITLEIGFGMGSSLITMAKEHPEQDFLGIEVYLPGVCSCIVSAHEKSLVNLRIIHHEAYEVLHQMIPDNSLDIVQLFFPDPWNKLRHNKRRLVQVPFAKLVKKKLKLGGLFHIITDWKPYAKHILEVIFSFKGYKNYVIRKDHIAYLISPRPITKFEQRAHRLNYKIWDLIFEKIE